MCKFFTLLLFTIFCELSICVDDVSDNANLIPYIPTCLLEKVSFILRNLLAKPTEASFVNHTQNEMHGQNNVTGANVEEDAPSAKTGTEAAVLIIVGIVLLSIIGMVVYFLRKFDQLNRSVPTYRYSSLKTEINGVYGPDDKIESNALVNVSTEEEDYDDDDEENTCPTLMVRSQQTVSSTNLTSNGVQASLNNSLTSSKVISKSDMTLDSDDELLQ